MGRFENSSVDGGLSMNDEALDKLPGNKGTRNLEATSAVLALFHETKDSVLQVNTEKEPGLFARSSLHQQVGTGFFVANDPERGTCDIATVNRILPRVNVTDVVMADGQKFKAKIVERQNELAILHIDGVKDADRKCKVLPLSEVRKETFTKQEGLRVYMHDGDLTQLSTNVSHFDKVSSVFPDTYKRADFVRYQGNASPPDPPKRDMIISFIPGSPRSIGSPLLSADGQVIGIHWGTVTLRRPDNGLVKSLEIPVGDLKQVLKR